MSRDRPKRRREVPPIVAAVVQPVARRLSRIEDLLIEMRHEQDVQLKLSAALQEQIDNLTEHVTMTSTHVRRMSRRKK